MAISLARNSAPGVYVFEIPSGARPIQAVGTSTAGFVGVAPDAGAHVDEAVPITSWLEFVRVFADGVQKRIAGKPDLAAEAATPLACAVYGFFQNGGTMCFIVNVGKDGSVTGASGEGGVKALETVDEVAIVAAPGFTSPGDYAEIQAHCGNKKDRVGVLDAPRDVGNNVLRLKDRATKDVPAAAPSPKPPTAGGGKPLEPAGLAPAGAPTAARGNETGGLRPEDSEYSALYFPWVLIRNPFDPKQEVVAPPSGHMAGIYARVDATRGVFKAPANEAIRGVLGLTYRVNDQQQGELNQEGVNCIRFFPRQGHVVWGARTLAAASSPWRYLNVRRLFCMIEKSILQSTRWIVFEPNDQSLWKAIRRDISAFLTLLWRQGALRGSAPEDAFFVKCDDETNPASTVDDGQVNTVIGIAPVKPAEFVIFEIGQAEVGAEVTVR